LKYNEPVLVNINPTSESMSKLKQVVIYTDGACVGNPGPGGYGVVLLHGKHRKELSGGFRLTTNNRMEVFAAIVGLQALKTKCSVTIHTDSQYLVQTMMNGWAERWRARGWKRNKKDKAINPDLWETLLELSAQHEVKFVWVRGHAGNKENERCDQLAERAARQSNLPPDKVYEEVRSQPQTANTSALLY
jgi:ribonuclease HI